MQLRILRIPLALLATAALGLTAAAQTGRGSGGFRGGGGFQGPGGGGGFPGSSGQFGQGGGFQGGTFGSGFGGGLAFGKTIQLNVFCNDLFAAAPDPSTRFAGATGGEVQFEDGSVLPLDAALKRGLLILRGARQPMFFGPGDRDRPLRLALTNVSGAAVRLRIPAGASVIPQGKRPPQLHPRTDRMLAAAQRDGIRRPRLLQLAVWASTGSTRFDIEQMELRPVSSAESRVVETLLKEGGIGLEFERLPGQYDRLYTTALRRLGADLSEVSGKAKLPNGRTLKVEGFRNDDGEAIVTLRRSGSEHGYYFRARYAQRGKAPAELTLINLKTGRQVPGPGSRLHLTRRS